MHSLRMALRIAGKRPAKAGLGMGTRLGSESGWSVGSRPGSRVARLVSGGNRARWPKPVRSGSKCTIGIVLLLISGFALSGCGGSAKLQLSLARDASFERPTYVGVYFLSQESVLDGEPLVDLIDKPDQYTEGVVRKEFVTVYPGDSKSIDLDAYDPKIGWIVVVADLTDSPCARLKQAVKSGSSLRMEVAVEEECLTLRSAQ